MTVKPQDRQLTHPTIGKLPLALYSDQRGIATSIINWTSTIHSKPSLLARHFQPSPKAIVLIPPNNALSIKNSWDKSGDSNTLPEKRWYAHLRSSSIFLIEDSHLTNVRLYGAQKEQKKLVRFSSGDDEYELNGIKLTTNQSFVSYIIHTSSKSCTDFYPYSHRHIIE